jgi:hypothetical protein
MWRSPALGQFKSCLAPNQINNFSVTRRAKQNIARCWWIGTNLVRDVNTIAVSHDMKGYSAHHDAGFLSTDQEQRAVSAPVKSKVGILALSRDAHTSSMNRLVFGFMLLFHLGAIAALFFFTWSALVVAVILHVVAINVGIGMGYQRLLTHRGYQVPRWMNIFWRYAPH